MDENQQTPQEANPTLEIPEPKSEAQQSLEASREPILGQNEAPRPALKNYLIGLGFVSISIFGAMAFTSLYLPSVVPQAPAAQAAAAAAVQTDAFKTLELSARAVYIFDVGEDKEIFAKNANAQLPLASITKVALVLAVAEVLPLDSVVTISREAVEKGAGGLTWGEEWRVRDLIDYTLITSSNTGAEALAEAASLLLAGKYPEAQHAGNQKNATVWRMNALVRELGMQETYFINVTGLDESPTQAGAQSSARDIAKLFAYALRTNKELFAGTTRTDVPLSPLNFPERYAHNTNNALAEIGGLLMGKTGTTDLAGGNLAVAFEKEAGRPIIIVVLGSTATGRFEDIKKLVDAAQSAAEAR